jgi:hypothetical protein
MTGPRYLARIARAPVEDRRGEHCRGEVERALSERSGPTGPSNRPVACLPCHFLLFMRPRTVTRPDPPAIAPQALSSAVGDRAWVTAMLRRPSNEAPVAARPTRVPPGSRPGAAYESPGA